MKGLGLRQRTGEALPNNNEILKHENEKHGKFSQSNSKNG